MTLPVRRIRDLSVLSLDEDRLLVVACDSIGSIGDKPHDTYAASPETTAHFALRVPLLEAWCAGGVVELVVDTLGVEREPTGGRMIEQILRDCDAVGIGPDRVTGSTEDNVVTVSTGIGVTVIAVTSPDAFAPGSSRSGDLVLCLGHPTSAPDDRIDIGDRRMVPLAAVQAVRGLEGVHDMVPVGSHGLAYEVDQLADSASLRADLEAPDGWDLAKSGGPSSCVIVSIAAEALDECIGLLPDDLPWCTLGTLVPR